MLLIAVTVGALIAMRVYVLRGVQQKYRESADVFGQGEQYAAGRSLIINLDGGIIDTNTEIIPIDTCGFVVAEVARLEKEIGELNAKAGSLEQTSADALERIPILQHDAAVLHREAASLRSQAETKQRQIAILTGEAANLRVQAEKTQDEIDRIKLQYSECFTQFFGGRYDHCIWVRDEVDRLEKEKAGFLAEADTKEKDAIRKDAEARSLRLQADSKDEEATVKEMKAGKLQAVSDQSLLLAAGYRQDANTKSARVSKYKIDRPDCF